MTQVELRPCPLKECPFCGQHLVERGDYSDGGAAYNWFAHDEDSKCIAKDIRVNVAWDRRHSDYDRWNTRPAPESGMRETLKSASEALQPLARGVFNDNGDMTITLPRIIGEHCVQAYFAERKINNALSCSKGGWLDTSTISPEVAAHMRSLGRIEWGAVRNKTDEEHVADFRDSLRLTREAFGVAGDRQDLSGCYLEGSETVVCHTGTSPNSAETARIITGLWNSVLDHLPSAPAGGGEEDCISIPRWWFEKEAIPVKGRTPHHTDKELLAWDAGVKDTFAAILKLFGDRTASAPDRWLGIPEGWQLVPVEPTKEMRAAFHVAQEEHENGVGYGPDHQWKAMLTSSPSPEGEK